MKLVFMVVRVLLALSVVTAAALFVRDVIDTGILSALSSLPARLVDGVVQAATLPIRLITGILGAALTVLKSALLNLFDVPLTIAWSVVPGLSLIPQPKAADIF